MERNCAVREKTADGVSVGRCWFFTDYDENTGVLHCTRHGNVTAIQEHFHKTGELGEDPRVRCKRCQFSDSVNEEGYCTLCSQIED